MCNAKGLGGHSDETAAEHQRNGAIEKVVYITAVHLAGGTAHQHISHVRWRNPIGGTTGESSTADMVDWIDNQSGVAKVKSFTDEVLVGTVIGEPKYLRTHVDGAWTDNLLALQRF